MSDDDLIRRGDALGAANHLGVLTVDEIDALPDVTPGVRVKPLVWEDFDRRGAKAQAWKRGNYLITYWKSRDAFEVVESYPGYQGDAIGDGFYPTLESAKVAAQADYEARILSALDLTPQPDTEVKPAPDVAGLVEAAKALRDDMLQRAETKIDRIRGEKYRVVNAGNTAWTDFCAALAAMEGKP